MSTLDLAELKRLWHDLGVALGQFERDEKASGEEVPGDAERAE